MLIIIQGRGVLRELESEGEGSNGSGGESGEESSDSDMDRAGDGVQGVFLLRS